ncbi:MAG: Rpn family recombination-promoting nuclease/putative transposase [Bacteroides sp.]|nr:Rpn family recombination-promoting nuclease/putative transposase [Bacteroides sp.]
MNENNLLIRFDYAMKRILQFYSDFSILEGLVSTVLEEQIHIINIFRNADRLQEKYDNDNRIDILAKTSQNKLVLIELQNLNGYAYYERTIFGASKFITGCVDNNEEFPYIHKIYSINIVYFPLGTSTDFIYHGKTEFRGLHRNELLELTPFRQQEFKVAETSRLYPEYYILKVFDFKKQSDIPLEQWAYYLSTGQIPENAIAPGLQEARELLRLDYFDKKEMNAYFHHLDDLVILEDNISTGRLEGYAEAIKETALKLKKMGLSVEQIMTATGLSQARVEQL